ncbi:MAG TPA: protein kinase, partial [Thermoanaerobaculia bacterium]|nr:protein kinase [Thermoanaerobaculia bacterium]
KVKVLDFGLAKAMDPPPGSASAADLARSPTLMSSPTMTAAQGTQLGVILGTAAYMSPEQARGGAIDERADVWAFGVVLWEMLSGKKLFAADSVPDTLAGVLRAEIDLDAVPESTPPPIRRLLRRCLERNPKNRLHHIADARIVLDEVLRGETDEAVAAPAAPPAAPPRPRWQLAAALLVAALAGAGLLLALLRWTAPAPEAPRVIRFEIPAQAGTIQVGAPKISPDGRHIAYTATDEKGTPRVWLRSLDSTEARPLAGTEGVSTTGRPFWSPDSRFVAYFTSGELYKVPIEGGPPQKIADSRGADASWSERGMIFFDGTTSAPILGVPASGGVAKTIVASGEEGDDFEVAWPQFLPGGERFVYIVFGGAEEHSGVWIADADGGNARRVIEGLSRVEFAPPGWLLFVRESTLVAQRFDPVTGELAGEPIPVADGLGVSSIGQAEFSASAQGVLAFRATGGGANQLAAYDLKGSRATEPIEDGNTNHPTFSRDGRWLAFDRPDDKDNRDIWVRDLRRGVSSRVTFDPGGEWGPLFSPDASAIYFTRSVDGKWPIVERSLASGAERVLDPGEGELQGPVALSPDGRFLVLARFSAGGGDLVILDLEQPGPATPFTSTPEFAEFRADFSPDGRWLAFQSNESGRSEIYVQSFPVPGRKWQVSTAGGSYPIWSPDGGTIYYRSEDQQLTRVAVEAGAAFDAGVPEPLFALPIGFGNSLRKIALSPDGERLVVVSSAGERTSTPTTVIVGWDAVLPR